MKLVLTRLSAKLGMIAFMGFATSSRAAIVSGMWEMNGNLDNVLLGAPAMSTVGWSPTFTGVNIGGVSGDVLEIPALSGSQLFSFTNLIGANGNGSRTNEFSIGWDVNFRSFQTFESLLQTSAANADDVDVFMNLSRLDPTSVGPLLAETWYRIIMVSQTSGAGQNVVKFYIDGSQVSQFTPTTDSRYSLSPLTPNHIFTDDNNETGNAYLNSFAVWNGALTAQEVTDLGSASAGGFSAPEPGIAALLLVGAAALSGRRNRRCGK